jgi:hypothetical protein
VKQSTISTPLYGKMRPKEPPVVAPRQSLTNGNGTTSHSSTSTTNGHLENGNGQQHNLHQNGNGNVSGHLHSQHHLVELNPRDHDIKVVIRNGRIVAGEETLPFKNNRLGM